MRCDCSLSLCAAAAACLVLGGCMRSDTTFAQLEGFAEVIRLQSAQHATAHERVLLEKYRPVLYVADGQEGPLDFYADYIAAGCLRAASAQLDDCAVDRAKLNAAKLVPDAVFTHVPDGRPPTPVGYGGVYRGEVRLAGLEPELRPWLFLRYNFAFRHSGIATGIRPWQALLLGAMGSLRDWHQLDHYTAAVVVLDENDRPVAVMLQQHNYMRTYLVGTDPAFPRDGPLQVNAAKRSNEFYPHRDAPTGHKAVSFLSKHNVDWLAGDGRRPLLGTIDETSADRRVDYELQILPPDDAFYIFTGRLGAKRGVAGRDGPPGAIYYTLPQMWPFENSLALFYWESPDDEYIASMQQFSYDDPLGPLAARQRRLTRRLVELQLVK